MSRGEDPFNVLHATITTGTVGFAFWNFLWLRRVQLVAFKCTKSCMRFLLSWALLDKQLATQRAKDRMKAFKEVLNVPLWERKNLTSCF